MNSSEVTRNPVLFACAGCSNTGRVAYDVARDLDQRGVAEMSCLAGVAARRKPFLRKLDGREVWVVDGCPINCALGVFEQIERSVDVHVKLFDFGFRKNRESTEEIDMQDLSERILETYGTNR